MTVHRAHIRARVPDARECALQSTMAIFRCAKQALRRTEAQEIVDAALFLAGGTLRNGSTVFVDSGQHLLDQDRDVIYLAREKEGEQ